MTRTYRALLVANSTFPNDPQNLPELEGPRNDPALLRDALCDGTYGLFPSDNVRLVVERTMAEVLREAEEFLRTANNHETLLLYYSGHGLLDLANELYLCTRDSRADRLRSTAVRASDLGAMIGESAAATTIILLDCCHSGAFKGGGDLSRVLAGNGRFVVTSCRGGELANDAHAQNRASMFTHHVVEGILGGAPDHDDDGFVGLNELYGYVHDRLIAENRQIPQRSFAGAGDVPMARRRAGGRRDDDGDLVDPSEKPPELDVSPEAIDLRDVDAGDDLPPERVAVINRGGGTLRWSAECTAGWLTMERDAHGLLLHARPGPGTNRANVVVRDDLTGMVKTVRVIVRARSGAADQDGGAGEGADRGATWPSSTDYTAVVQDPASAFLDEELRHADVLTNSLGLPRASTGQNAVVFQLASGSEQLAVRCFVASPEDGPRRYRALEQHLSVRPCDPVVPARWLDDGIVVDGTPWPVVVMPWVSGLPLDLAAAGIGDSPARLQDLAARWHRTVELLEAAEIDHGDLQHGNVLVDQDLGIELIDLDSVWVSSVTTAAPNETGHPSYQHPRRTRDDWGRGIDVFSALLIYTSLRALAADASLVGCMTGENLVLTRDDLEHPGATEAWQRLLASPDAEVAGLVALLADLCRAPSPPKGRLADYVARARGRDRARDRERLPDGDDPPTDLPSLPPLPDRADDDWWREPRAADAPPADTTTRPRVAAAGGKAVPAGGPSLRARSAKNVVVSGAVGGGLAGAVGSLLQGLVHGALGPRTEGGVLVVLIAALLGATLNSWQELGAGSRASGIRRLLAGLSVGAVGGVVAVAIGDAMAVPLLDRHETENAGVVLLVWVLVAVLVGLAVGALRSLRGAVSGVVGGAVGGLVGGWIFSQAGAEFERRALMVDGGEPATLLAAAVAAAVVGCAIGLVARTLRRATLTIIEGRAQGVEVVIHRRSASIGAGPKNLLVLAGDPNVAAHHATIDLSEGSAHLDAAAVVVVDGEAVTGRRPLSSGSVLQIGGSFLRFESRP